LAWCRSHSPRMRTLERGLHDVRRAKMRAAGSGRARRTCHLARRLPGRGPRHTSGVRWSSWVQGGRAPAGRPLPAGRDSPPRRSNTMSAADKIKNAAQDLAGKAKEAAGKVTGNEKLQAEGKTDQTKADAKKAGENIKDGFNNSPHVNPASTRPQTKEHPMI